MSWEMWDSIYLLIKSSNEITPDNIGLLGNMEKGICVED